LPAGRDTGRAVCRQSLVGDGVRQVCRRVKKRDREFRIED
jgi:hypothetical protein